MATAGNLALTEPRAGDLPPLACIVGAPRCGTTSLARMLSGHPDVLFSKVKEPHFFSLHDLRAVADEELWDVVEEHYLARYFPDIPDGTRLLAEGSVSYLYAAERMAPLLRLWPGARFIIALRNPLDLLPSLHQRLLFQSDESVRDFSTAWRLQGERARGRRIPRSCVDARQLQYAEVARLGKHVDRFTTAVGRHRCQFVLYDDFTADPGRVYRELLTFLGLSDDGRHDFPRHRASSGFRIAWLQRLLKRPPVATQVLAGEKFHRRAAANPPHEPSAVARHALEWRKRLLRWNRVRTPRTELPDVLRQEIRALLADDIALLSRIIGKDLPHWLAAPAHAAAESRPVDQNSIANRSD